MAAAAAIEAPSVRLARITGFPFRTRTGARWNIWVPLSVRAPVTAFPFRVCMGTHAQ